VPPAVNAVTGSSHDDHGQQDVQNLTAPTRNPVSHAVGKQHRRVAELVVLQFTRALLFVFSQGTSFASTHGDVRSKSCMIAETANLTAGLEDVKQAAIATNTRHGTSK
jgi:hypothetical protein